jgi:hypothetical protein
VKSSFKYGVIPNLADVDGVILISGRDGTANIGYAAYSMGKPVVAITSFKGAAQGISKDILHEDYRHLANLETNKDAKCFLNENDLRVLDDANWGKTDEKYESKIKDIVTAAEHLVNSCLKPMKKYLSALGFKQSEAGKWTRRPFQAQLSQGRRICADRPIGLKPNSALDTFS